jgi:ATP-dependent Clp protease adaptor protein ClpS
MKYQVEEQSNVLIDELESTGLPGQLVVLNDDVNTFDWVIMSFMEVLKHSLEQAEQLSLLVHYKGKAAVKSGSFDSLRKYKDALTDRGLSAIIEEVKA